MIFINVQSDSDSESDCNYVILACFLLFLHLFYIEKQRILCRCSVTAAKDANFINLKNSHKIKENSYNGNIFPGVIRKTRKFI